jgi:NADH-quinone oxidoreductase subunit H
MAWLPKWNLFTQPLAFALFTVCIFAESNRTPFDLPECETELVGGYHTEYSSMKFALFFLAEYCSMIVGAAVVVTLFLGGWHLPWADHLIYGGTQPVSGGWVDAFIKFGVFWGKIVAFLFLYMWVRWTLPRFRFDQLMNLAWRGLIPLSVGTFLIPTTVIMLQREGIITAPALWLFVGNVVLLVGTLVILAVLPKSNPNPRASLARSRYNPQLVRPVTE